jgi:twinkle protein
MNLLPDDIDFEAYLQATEIQVKVIPAEYFIADLKTNLVDHKEGKKVTLPWVKTEPFFHFRPGEVTIWAGQNGHGKSMVTTQVALGLIQQKQKVCIASFEMKPVTTMSRMARQFIGMNPTSKEFMNEEGIKALEQLYDEFGEWLKDGLWFYDQQGSVKPDTVLGMIKYCFEELKMQHIFVDSLMKCVMGEDDYNGQKYFIDRCCGLARDYSGHIHVVHHLRKPKDEYELPDKHDNKGSGSITDQPDNIMLVWRNKKKEDDVKTKGILSSAQSDPDAMILCRKQRNGEDEPTFNLWYHKDSQQYVEEQGKDPIRFNTTF